MSGFKFSIDWQKAIEGVHYLVSINPGITPYYIAKVFFYADKQHMIDWGRSICGDHYVAMEHGPVPSGIYNLVRSDMFLDDDIVAEFERRVQVQGRRLTIAQEFQPTALSKTDIEYLKNAEGVYAHMTFGALRDLVHKEPSWREAWESCQSGSSAVMDMTAMIDEDIPNRAELIEEIHNKTAYAPH
jgi:uncharacterized phage-associated protein